MGLCSKRFGYQSPAVGGWAIALSLQLSLGILLLLIGYASTTYKEMLEKENAFSSRYQVLQYLGIAHIVLAIAVAAVVALGLFISSCFLLPLCIISIVQNIFLVATAVICGYFLHPFFQVVKFATLKENIKEPDGPAALLAFFNAGYLLTGACLSLAGLAAYGRASSMKNDTPIVEAQLYVPCAVLLVSTATIFAVGGGGVGYTVTMAAIWYGLALALALLVSLANCCLTPKFFNIVVGAAFACVAVFGVISCCVTAHTYNTALSDNPALGETSEMLTLPDAPENVKIFLMMGAGRWLLAVSCTALATAVLAVYAACYALRSVIFCCGKGDTS